MTRQRCCLPVRTFSVGQHLAVDEQHGALAAEQIAEVAAAVGGHELAALVEPHVRQQQDEVVAERRRIGRVLDDERAVEAAADLRRRVRVRVIPVRAGVAQLELVAKLAAAFDRRLRDAGRAVHLVRHAQSVPMNRRRLGQRVLEVHDDAVAELGANHRARHRAVVGPRARRRAGQDLDVRDARLELDLEHVRIGIQVRAARPSRARRPSRPAGSRRAPPAAAEPPPHARTPRARPMPAKHTTTDARVIATLIPIGNVGYAASLPCGASARPSVQLPVAVTGPRRQCRRLLDGGRAPWRRRTTRARV